MHGFNKHRYLEGSEKGYQVHDIWYTIQGEGPFAGERAVFVRLTGCNLACASCDTVWDDEKDPYLSAKEIALKIRECNKDNHLVILTGGEPCRWDLTDLIEELHDYTVQIETAGTYWQQCLLNSNVVIICSPKIAKVNPKFLQHCDHWKYPVQEGDSSDEDGLPVFGTQRPTNWAFNDPKDWNGGKVARPPKDRKVAIYLQPWDVGDPIQNKANQDHMVKIAMKYGYRAGLQLHKIFGVA